MDSQTNKPCILIDGSSYLFRAYHALPALTNSTGQSTGAVYGVLNMLRKLIKEYQPDHIAIVFDPKGKTTRHKIDANYKANRPPMPEELATQIQPLHHIIKAMGIPLIIINGIEADDIIGTLAHRIEETGMPVIISTGDKDMTQLVNSNITLINTMTNTKLDKDGVIKKFGVAPNRIIDYLALIGDSVDNIPGVPKVGPKTAVKWLNQYGSLTNILHNAKEIPGKVGESLRSHISQIPISQKLVTIDCDIALPIDVKDLAIKEKDNEKLKEYFSALEFKTWLTELLRAEETEDTKDNDHYTVILTKIEFQTWLNKLKSAKVFAFDTETTSLDPLAANIVGISFSTTIGEAAYVPVGHTSANTPTQLPSDYVLNSLKPLLEDPTITVIGQNLKYDMSVLSKYNIVINGIYDTMLASYVINSTATRHNLDQLALYYLSKTLIHFEDVAGKGSKQLTFDQVPLEQAAPYAAEDADIALQLYSIFSNKLSKDATLNHVLNTIEIPLISVLIAMEQRGVLIDANMLETQSSALKNRINALKEAIFQLANTDDFNINSTKQLRDILYTTLKLPVLKKTPKGQPSTAEPVLQKLSIDYPLPRLILEYRSLTKLKSTYTDKLPQQIHPITHRVHCSYNQAVTATGRLSSTNPNLQNIPIRTEEGKQIRHAFVAPAGYKILAADYSQIELRLMAHISHDESLIRAFNEGKDIHQATAADIFNTPLSQVTPDQRRHAKTINFGLIYGMSAYGLAKQLGVDNKTAQDYIDCYFSRYPGVLQYMEETRQYAKENGFVETLYGRRLYLPDIQSKNTQQRLAAERAAINAPMQGSAADLIKLAMIAIHNWLQDTDIDAYLIMQVHDELVFEVAEPDVNDALIKIEHHMTQLENNKTTLSVPLTVEIGVGDSWGAAH